MIRFSNGKEAMFFAASGALGFDGRGWPHERLLQWISGGRWFDPALFWQVSKTITTVPRGGTRGQLSWLNVRPILERRAQFPWFELVGWVNALGMRNDGPMHWLLKHARPEIRQRNFVLSVASVDGDRKKRLREWEAMMGIVALWCEGMRIEFAALELNLSCPNTEQGKIPDADEAVEFCRTAKARIKIPLIAKLSVAQDCCATARRLERERLVEAISINSVPWRIAFPARISPLATYGGGGVSGKIVQPFTWEMVRKLSGASSIPAIAPSIWNYGDIDHVLGLGAGAVHFGSVFIASPWWPAQAVRRWNEERKIFGAR